MTKMVFFNKKVLSKRTLNVMLVLYHNHTSENLSKYSFKYDFSTIMMVF